MSDKQLMRSNDRIVAGVAAGLAEYFDTSAALIRVLFVLTALLGFGGISVLLYIVLWIILPEPIDKA